MLTKWLKLCQHFKSIEEVEIYSIGEIGIADPQLLENKSLVLSAKVRNQFENDIIMDGLLKNFRKKIDLENLFSFHAKTSLVTKQILEKLISYKGQQNGLPK